MNKKLLKEIIPIFSLALSLLILPENSISVFAQTTTTTYSPPKQRKKIIKSRILSAGSRGCNKPSLRKTKVLLLAPEDHVGLTTSGHPNFFWQVTTANAPVKIRFTLVDPDAVEPIADLQQTVQSSGIVKLQLPSQLPELKQGKPYMWTVSLICNPKRPSQNAYAYSWIERVEGSVTLTQHLKVRNTDPAAIYAQEGIWYDALAEAYKHSSSSQLFLSLLTQLDQINKI